MNKRIAIITYGMPHMIEHGISWRARYVKELADKMSTNLDMIDWYYHLYDGIYHTSSESIFNDENIIQNKYAVHKKYNMASMWLSDIVNVSTNHTMKSINEIHTMYRLGDPIWHAASEIHHLSFMDYIVRTDIHNRATSLYTQLAESSDNIVSFLIDIDRVLNDIFQSLIVPIWSLGNAYDLYHTTDELRYDAIILTKTDSVLDPSTVTRLAHLLLSDDISDNYCIYENHPSYGNYTPSGLFEPGTYFIKERAMKIIFDEWYDRMLDIILMVSINRYMRKINIVKQNFMPSSNVLFELAKTHSDCNIFKLLKFKNANDILGNQATLLIGSLMGIDNKDPTHENFLTIRGHWEHVKNLMNK